MTSIRHIFRDKSRDLATVIAGHTRPLTFVLGAGASLSSGAPPTPKVHARFAEATQGRFEGQVREHFHELKLPEVRGHLQPLFDEVIPDVGYRLMASLGRSRRIYAVVLNWDDAIKQACEAVGTPVECFDPLREGNFEAKDALLPPNQGILVVHVHGTLEGARYGFLETAPNHPEIWESVAPLLQHETIICGASLVGDLDVTHVIQQLSSRGREDAATWLFTRPGGDPPPVPIPTDWEQVEDQQVDFDDLMIILAEEVLAARGQKQTRWDELVDGLPHLGLPRIEKLVELKPEVRRRALAARVAGLVAPPFSGKSVGVVRLGHLRRLIDGVERPLRVSIDPQDSPAELAISAALGDIVVVVDDPFGSNDPQTNPRVRDFLLALCEKDGGYACVSSPSANWKDEAGRLLGEPEGLYTTPGHAGDWYERDRLAQLAELLPHKRAALRRVHAGTLETPPEVVEVGRTGQTVNTKRLVEDKRRLLDKDPRLGLLCAMVRLQERSNSPISAAELTAILECDPETIRGIDGLLLPQQLEETSFWVFNHSTSAKATDFYLSTHLTEVRERLEQAKVLPAWIDRCLAGWALASGQSFDLAGDLDPEDGLEPADWMAQRLGSRPTEADLASMELVPHDEWATIDFAYEVVRVWDSIKRLHSGHELLDELSTRWMGLYGLLEGCLYFGVGAEDELWTNLMHRLYRLPKDPGRRWELLLILDAVMWRAPKHEPLRDWASEAIAGLPTDSPEFAIVRFASGYHPAGLAELGVEEPLAADAKHAWTPAQAAVGAELAAWHFAHQSRARVLLHRRIDLDKEWLCQSLGQVSPKDGGDPEPQLRLIGSLADFAETAGWAFHLACNLAVVAGLDLRQERVRALVEAALRASQPGDTGVTSAVISYRSADLFARELRQRFADKTELERLLSAMGLGLEIPGEVMVEPPRFRFVHEPASVYEAIGETFPEIDPALPREPVKLAAGLWEGAADILKDQARHVRRHVSGLIERVGRGDLQPLLAQGRLKEDTGDPYKDAVLRMLQDPSLKEGGLF